MQQKTIIYGLHAIEAALNQPKVTVQKLFVQQGRQDQRLQHVLQLAEQASIEITTVDKSALANLVGNVSHQGIAASCVQVTEYAENDLAELLEKLTVPAFLLILDGVQDPHNLGACLRTADAAGVHAVIAPKDRAVGITPVVRKVACGAAENVPFIQVTNLARTLQWLKDRGIWLYGLSDDADANIYQTDLTGPLAIVLGAEGAGMRRLTRDNCDVILQIPMAGTVASLNVSVAGAISLFEAVRQRTKPIES